MKKPWSAHGNMLSISKLTVGYHSKKILRDVTLNVRRGETLAVVGESGTGKTTLALSLLGLLAKHENSARVSGSIRIGDAEVTELDEPDLRQIRWKRISLVFQSTADALNPVHTVFAQVREPLIAHDICAGDAADRRARETLASAGLSEDRFQAYPHELSTGEKQRVLIAMALVCDPDVIVLDEPTSSLDPFAKESVVELLRERCADKACLVITHDLSTAANLGDRIAVLCGGRIVEEGPMQETMADPRHPYSRGLIRCFPDMNRTKDLQGMRGRASFREHGCPFYGRCT